MSSKTPRFMKVFCSQCGREFGPGDQGFSACVDHRSAPEGDAADAARWRRLVNASEMAFPAATVVDDPENDARTIYGRKRLEQFIDMLDEIPNTYPEGA